MLPWFQFTTVHIGPVPIQVWGFFVAMGMLLSIVLIQKEAKKRNLSAEPLLDLALKMIVYGVIGARLFHIFFYEPAFFIAHPAESIAVWHGGLSSFGGLVGAMLAFVVALKRKKIKKEFLSVYGNIISYSALYGWIVGRIGCLMIHDHLGKESNCPLAFVSPQGKRLDMALLEILGLLPLAIAFFILKKKKKEDVFAPVLFVYYGILRFILDFWRAEPTLATGDVR
ncbi:MAG: prolipoprotein diacylglyceryl transferase, partial [Candidatus Magasanikbacteria bacterium]|nr:prolipoprotein diacylglyceryl transferase [Candidatus Magasanikbacteria bacterium]